MKTTAVSQVGKLEYAVYADESDGMYYVDFTDGNDDKVEIYAADIDYPFDSAGPFDTYSEAERYALKMVRDGWADDGSEPYSDYLPSLDKSEYLPFLDESDYLPALDESDYFGAMHP